jgi:hypothetical protein
VSVALGDSAVWTVRVPFALKNNRQIFYVHFAAVAVVQLEHGVTVWMDRKGIM